MKPFLQIVAEDLYQRFGHDMSHVVVVFPNKRAGIFFNTYIAACAGTPVWAPHYQTIHELFTSLSDKAVADPIETICRLYRLYVRHTASKLSLDNFYGWGERLLADFDDVDKNMADADRLFQDIKEYGALDEYGGLDEEQQEQLRHFSADFKKENIGEIRRNFNNLWQVMRPMYHELRDELAGLGKAYEGQLYREVAEALSKKGLRFPDTVEAVAFVGFNVIDKVEHLLFDSLRQEGRALFYWDYDTYYVGSHESYANEAGTFIRQNLKDFPCALGSDCYNNFLTDRSNRTIEFATATTEHAQVQDIPDWLHVPGHYDPQHARRTAIVLCNENLLQPVLHAIPSQVGEINVTKGFPLAHTPAFSTVVRFMKQKQYEHDQESARSDRAGTTSQWPVGQDCLPALEELRSIIEEESVRMQQLSDGEPLLHDLYAESYFQVYTAISRLQPMVREGLLDMQLPTLLSLLRQILRTVSVPFHGEPAVGLQVMGVLETRCLDFDNVLMISVGEGTLPQKTADASFIPFLLRRLHGLTTPDRRISVYAYYFYRLLQRARHVRLTYSTATEGMQKGEMSRFMRALLVESNEKLHIRHINLNACHRIAPPLRPDSTAAHRDFVERVRKKGLSPSVLKYYFKCPLSFYYRYIMGLRTPQKADGIINANDFGTIFHKAAEIFFMQALPSDGASITPTQIERLLKDKGEPWAYDLVYRAFKEVEEECKTEGKAVIPYSQIAHQAITKYLVQLLRFEAGTRNHAAPAVKICNVQTEQLSEITLDVHCGEETIPVRLYGYIDRRDEAVLPDGRRCIRIIDYKTGKRSKRDKVASMDSFFSDIKDYPDNALQTFIYSLMWMGHGLPVVPMLYYIPSMPGKDFTPYIELDKKELIDFTPHAAEFRDKLIEKLSEILDPETTFEPTQVTEHCKYCDYKLLCGRNDFT